MQKSIKRGPELLPTPGLFKASGRNLFAILFFCVTHHLIAGFKGLLVELFGSLRDSGENRFLDCLGVRELLHLKSLGCRAERNHVDNDLAAKFFAGRSDDRQHVDICVKLRRIGDKEIVEDDRSARGCVV